MSALLEIEATVTSRGQTTIPSAIRKALGVEQGKVVFRQLADGSVVIAPAPSVGDVDGDDPAIAAFLAFLERDMVDRPDLLRPVPADLLARGTALTEGIELDLDAPLTDD